MKTRKITLYDKNWQPIKGAKYRLIEQSWILDENNKHYYYCLLEEEYNPKNLIVAKYHKDMLNMLFDIAPDKNFYELIDMPVEMYYRYRINELIRISR